MWRGWARPSPTLQQTLPVPLLPPSLIPVPQSGSTGSTAPSSWSKRSAIDQAGLLDEDFFLYAEEAEWCGRLKKTGPLCIYGDLTVIHLQGETANKEFGSGGKGYYNFYDRKGLQIMLSNFVRIRKQFGIGWFLVQLFFYLADIPVFFIGLAFSKRYSFAQFRQYCKNIGVILRLSPTIIGNKPYFYKVL